MADDVARTSDTMMIRAVFERYARAIDRLDRELLESCFWLDAVDRDGAIGNSARGFIERVIPLLRERYEATMHTLGQSIIDVEDERAYAETYNVAYHRAQEMGRSTLMTVGNRYVDVLERREGEWRILDRKVLVEWSKLDAGVTVTYPADPLASRDRNDPAYARGS